MVCVVIVVVGARVATGLVVCFVVVVEEGPEMAMQRHLKWAKETTFYRMRMRKPFSGLRTVTTYIHHTYHEFPATSFSHTMEVSPWHIHGRSTTQPCGAVVVAVLEVVAEVVVAVALDVVDPGVAMQRHLKRRVEEQ